MIIDTEEVYNVATEFYEMARKIVWTDKRISTEDDARVIGPIFVGLCILATAPSIAERLDDIKIAIQEMK